MIALEKLSRKNTTKRRENVNPIGRGYLKMADNRLNISEYSRFKVQRTQSSIFEP
jgi:hypothetical protein